ncbi:hypothetical protein GGH15_003844, partial [Coemansia sp. RSA 562]
MSHFFFDFSKLNTPFDVTNGSDTVTICSTKHVVASCVCANCKSIVAAQKAEEAKKMENLKVQYKFTPPAAPKPPCCCYHHHHHHH